MKKNSKLKIDLKDFKEFYKASKVSDIERGFYKQVITLIIASLGLITALAWSDTLHDIYVAVFGSTDTLVEKITYTFVITLLAVVVSVILGKRYFKKINKRNKLR